MSHHIYHTRGLILSSVPIGESNRFYKIFTEELGLVRATAQAVRVQKSKLRYSLQDFSWVNFDLVRGKEVWRITSVVDVEQGAWNSKHQMTLARICALVSRLVHGEGRNDSLYHEIFTLCTFLETTALSLQELALCEALASLRILAHLGYLDPVNYQEFMALGVWSRELLMAFERVRSVAIGDINRAIKETHL